MSDIVRCINLDWLEVYCLESGEGFPHDADYFRSHGYDVQERDYGTRQYNQMFTILDKDLLGFVEIRRCPVASAHDSRSRGIFSPYSCHVRLVNRYCYHKQAVFLFTDFLQKHGYKIQRIYRLDLALDFEKFDDGTDPKQFLRRYMEGKFTKINQCNLSAHGHDRWEQRDWNSLSWGSPKSMVSTKFYNKTQELREAKDKPYIRYAWFESHLVDDWINLTKKTADGGLYQPEIWRVEFSIKSSARAWYIVEDCNGQKVHTFRQPHELGYYADKKDQLKAFVMLQYHYFHFKRFEPGVRKDRCEDRVLFNFGKHHEVLKLDTLLTDAPKDSVAEALKKRLVFYRMTHGNAAIKNACTLLITQLESEAIRNATPSWNRTEADFLQLLISRRMQMPQETLTESIDTVESLLAVERDLFK